MFGFVVVVVVARCMNGQEKEIIYEYVEMLYYLCGLFLLRGLPGRRIFV